MMDETITRLRDVMEAAGVAFIPENGGGPGVRLAKARGTHRTKGANSVGRGGACPWSPEEITQFGTQMTQAAAQLTQSIAQVISAAKSRSASSAPATPRQNTNPPPQDQQPQSPTSNPSTQSGGTPTRPNSPKSPSSLSAESATNQPATLP